MKQKKTRPFIISAICLLILVTGLGLIYIMQKQSPTAIGQIPEKPPEGIGASSLTNLCSRYRIDPDLVIKPLSFKGVALDPDIPLEKVADNNGLTLGALYDMIREAALGQKL